MKSIFGSLTLSLLSLMFCVAAHAQEADQLVYMTEEYRPYNFTENGELKGLSVDLLKLMWTKMGYPQQPIKVLPWARGYQYLQTRKNHVLFATSRTQEREELFKWVGPLYKVKFVLIAKTNAGIKIDSIEDAKQYRIGTIREDVSEQILTAAGIDINNLDRIADIDQNIRKLQTGRIDLISYSMKGFEDSLKSEGLDPNDFETLFVVKESQSYYAFNRGTPDTLIRKFQDSLDSLKDEHQAILDRYLSK